MVITSEQCLANALSWEADYQSTGSTEAYQMAKYWLVRAIEEERKEMKGER